MSLLFSPVGVFVSEYVGYFIFTFTGALLKEGIDANRKKGHKFSVLNIIASTVIGTLFALMFDQRVFGKSEWTYAAGVSFIFGLLGKELFEYFSSFEGIIEFVKMMKRLFLVTQVIESDSDSGSDEESEDEDKKNKAVSDQKGTKNGRRPKNGSRPESNVMDTVKKDIYPPLPDVDVRKPTGRKVHVHIPKKN